MNRLRSIPARALDRRGIALPLALLGLIAVSVVAATAVVTSSSELALSHAHQGGVSSIYGIDGAVDAFVARGAVRTSLVPGDSVDDGMKITVSRLTSSDTLPPEPAQPGDIAVRRETFAIAGIYWNEAADRRASGRRVGKLISTRRQVNALSFNVNAGATFGSDANITGNSLVSGVQDTTMCAGDSTVNAVTHATDVTVEYSDRNVEGEVKVHEDSLNSEELARHVMNGDSIMTIARSADIQFGPLFGETDFNQNQKPTSTSTTWPVGHDYNWGCPALLSDCELNGGDRTYYPTVAIDAKGGTIGLQGDHGQGVLIVVNGNLSITGNFTYQGIILVDGSLDVRGTGGTSTKIQGAVIATGQVTLARTGNTGSDISGNAMIQFNSCEIQAANSGMLRSRLNTAPQAFQGRTTGWFELVN